MNTKKLQEAYQKLGWVQDDVKCGRGVDINTLDYIKQQIHEFMVDCEPKKKGKFNIWDYTENDPYRPVYGGVFHDKENEVAVATDGYLLVACKESFDESKVDVEGFRMGDESKVITYRAIDKYGKFLNYRFPNWKAVIPPKDGYLQEYVSLEELDEYLKKFRAFLKLEGYGKRKPIPLYKVGNVWLNAEKLRKFIVASDGKVMVKSNDRPIVYWGEKRTALLMPMLVEDKDLLPEALEQGVYMKF